MISYDNILDAYVSTIQSANRWIITTIAFTLICLALIDQGFHKKRTLDTLKESTVTNLQKKIEGIERNTIRNRYQAGIYDAWQIRRTLSGSEEALYERIEKAYQDYPPVGHWHPKTEDSLKKSIPATREMIDELKKELNDIKSNSSLSDTDLIRVNEFLQTKIQKIRDYYNAIHNLINTYETLDIERAKPTAKLELPTLPTPIGGLSLSLTYALILFMLANCFTLSWINMKSRRLHRLSLLLKKSVDGSLKEVYDTYPLPIWAYPLPQELHSSGNRANPLLVLAGVTIQLIWLFLIFWLAKYCFTYKSTQELTIISSSVLDIFVIAALVIVTCSSVLKILGSTGLVAKWDRESLVTIQKEVLNPKRRSLILGGLSYISIFAIGVYLSKIAQSDKLIISRRQHIGSNENTSKANFDKLEAAMLEDIKSSPLQIWLYDRLIKFYGKHARHNEIYSFLLDARKELEKYQPEPWYAKRKRTTLRLLKERILRVEAIRKSKNLSI